MFEFLKRFRKKKVDSGNSINTIKSDLPKTSEYTPPYTTSSVLYVAPNVYLVARGAKVCVGRDVVRNEELSKRLSFIKRLTDRGHESVLEHSNIISLVEIIGNADITDLTELMSNMRYCHVKVREFGDTTYLLIGGSIRAYLNIIRETSKNNSMLNDIKNIMYNSIEKEFMSTLIKDGLMEEDKCNYLPKSNMDTFDNDEYTATISDPVVIKSDKADLLYSADCDKIFDKVKEYGFSMKDVLDVATISFLFHDVSRSCANQMTRHRVGISQESQRYVTHDYDKNKDFIDPIKLNLIDRYVDMDPKLIKEAENIDPFVHYKKLMKDGFLKEDSRAWLPMNVTTKLMMTFTYSQLLHFLKLRSEKAAQKEIRMLTDSIKEIVNFPKPDEKFMEYFKQHKEEYGYKDDGGDIDLAALIIYGLIGYTVLDSIYNSIDTESISNTIDETISESTEEISNNIESNMPEHLDTQTMMDSMNETIEENKNNYSVSNTIEDTSDSWGDSSGGDDW